MSSTDLYDKIISFTLSPSKIGSPNKIRATTVCSDHSLTLHISLYRFKLTYELLSDEADDNGETDDNSRPSFSSILKNGDSLDKELAASGFTKKDQEELERVLQQIFLLLLLFSFFSGDVLYNLCGRC